MLCKCKICNETWNYSSAISPMLNNDKWLQILNYYNIKNKRNTFICYKCMEKALERKIFKSDLMKNSEGKNVPFNIEFNYWYPFSNK